MIGRSVIFAAGCHLLTAAPVNPCTEIGAELVVTVRNCSNAVSQPLARFRLDEGIWVASPPSGMFRVAGIERPDGRTDVLFDSFRLDCGEQVLIHRATGLEVRLTPGEENFALPSFADLVVTDGRYIL